jgi:probable rRNA maturation factor
MIVIEPANLLASLVAAPNATSREAVTLRRRELSSFLALAAEAAGVKGHISVLLTDDKTIRELNRQYRKIDTSTDVLSFPAAEPGVTSGRKGAPIAGDLAISLNTAARQAAAFGHELQTEVKVLLLHGALHLAGLDHETDSGQMARRESALRKHFDLPMGLIQRVAKTPARKRGATMKKHGAPPTAKAKRSAKP